MIVIWRLFSWIGLVLIPALSTTDIYHWIGPGTDDRLLSAVLFGVIIAVLWWLFAQWIFHALGSRLINSTIQCQRRDRRRRESF